MNRNSVGVRLAIGFSFVVAILIFAGWLGLQRLARINASLNDINYPRWAKVQLAQQAITYSNLNDRLLQRAILSGQPGEGASLLYQRDLNVKRIMDIIQTLHKGTESAREKDLLRQLDQESAATAEDVARVTVLLNARKFKEARALMASDVILRINGLHEAWNAFTQFEELRIQQTHDENQADYDKARRLTAWWILIASLAAAAIGTFVTRAMVREVEQRERTKQEARKLSDDLEKKVAERTEELARAIRHLESEATERRRKEDDLRRLAAIVECSEDAIIAADLDGKITDWNPGAEKMFGYSRAEAAGMPVTIIISPEGRREALEILGKTRQGIGVTNQEAVRMTRDGKAVHVSLTVSPIRDQAGRVSGSAAIVRDITARIEMEAALRRSESNFRSVIENSPYGALRTLPNGRILLANPAVVRMLGYSSENDVLSLNMATDIYRNQADRARAIEQSRHTEYLKDFEVEWRHKNGSPITVRFSSHVVKNQAGEIDHFDLMVQDITRQRNLEEQLRQAQKMEAIGRLAGGVAHDFNNLLGVIIGYSELALDQIAASAVRGQVEQIRKAAERASALTRQLLAFSRQQVLDTKTLSLNAIISDMAQMLLRLIGEDVELQTKLESELHAIRGDQGQIEQVIMNLAVNARDAMPHGGKLMIETRNVAVEDDELQRRTPMPPGDYVLLSISDTGVGMDAETQAHIFEPFFTTKARGKGTGLGLATVYGVVKQSGGFIWVYSEPGVGSTFKVYLPRVLDEVPTSRPSKASDSHRGSETVLVVEDEASLRTFTCTLLQNSGYKVLEAGDGEEALALAGEYKSPIHLLLTDMIMPGMNGPAVAEKLAALHPEAKVLFMSGYTGFVSRGLIDPRAVLVSKPFTREELLRKIHQVLSAPTPAPANGNAVRA